MAGTIDGGKKSAETIKKFHGREFYQEIGRKGGSKRNTITPKGFAALSTERLREIASKGGKKSKRT